MTLRSSRPGKELVYWIPSEADRAFARGLMQRVVELGKTARGIATATAIILMILAAGGTCVSA